MVISADIFVLLLRYFYSSTGNLIINNNTVILLSLVGSRISPNGSLLGSSYLIGYLSGDILLNFKG